VSLQLRFSLASFLLTGLAVASLAVGAYVIAHDRVYGSIDDRLRSKAEAITASIDFRTPTNSASEEQIASPALTHTDIETNRRSLDAQAALGGEFRILSLEGFPLYPPSQGQVDSGDLIEGFHTRESGAESSRLLLNPILIHGQPIAFVEVQSSLAQADSSIREVRQVLIVGASAVAVVSAGLAFVIAGRAVRPVRELASLAEEVERTADFSKRLPVTPSASEMKAMAVTFNRMIGRIERLVQGQRTFLSDTSHELRRPLTILRTNLDVLDDPRLDEHERAAVVIEMQDVAESMSRLLAELHQLARQDEEAVHLVPTDLTSLCQSRVKVITQSHPRHRYECSLEPDVWVQGDAARLSRAVENLLQNAALYTPEPGIIDVELVSRDDRAIVRVADNGPGMSREEVEHAFERFYRGPGSRRAKPDGLGLGLAIVKQTMDRHGGTVLIESEVGKGTSLTLQLPLLRP
jgi:two-component system sensor histidine kinase MprB